METEFSQWVDKVSRWNNQVSPIPALVRDDINKSKIGLGNPTPERGLKSLLVDPLSIQYALGYKDRRYSLTYDVLKRIPHQLALVAAILQTRTNQVAAFSVPYRHTKSVGYVIKHKDPSRETTDGERDFIKQLETFIQHCGQPKPNKFFQGKRDHFEDFLKKIVRDSLVYDQCCFEVVPDRRGVPYEFIAVDAATMRIAAPNSQDWVGEMIARPNMSHFEEHPFSPFRNINTIDLNTTRPDFVQVVNGQIQNIYERDELAFGVRNPRSDIYIEGYGFGELEQLITIVTAHLYAEEYNRRFFMQGSAPKGLLNFKGDAMTPDQLEGFKRQWASNMEGVENAWRTPIIQAEQGIEWIGLQPSNAEMEYGQWMEYLIKIACAVFLIDPAELNFDLHGGVQQTPLFESSQEWKLKASRDRGLKPLLRFLARMINEHIISKIDDHFVFDFVGLDELTEQEKHELRKEQVASYMTLNEIRRAEDLPEVEYGDHVLNPVYLQAMQVELTNEQQKEMMEQQQQAQEQQAQMAQQQQQPQEQGAPQPPPGAGAQAPEGTPQYADSFSKSLESEKKYIKIDFDADTWRELYET